MTQPANRRGGLLWSAGGPLLRLTAQLGAQAALARLLSPTDYGIFAIILLTTAFVTFLSELGGAALLIKAKDLDNERIGVAFTLQLAIGVWVTLLLYGAAHQIAELFSKPEAALPLQWLAWNPLIVMAGITAMRLLAREMRFREIQLLTLGSYVVGYAGVAIIGASFGWGVKALVLGTLSQSLLQSTCAYLLARHSLRPRLKWLLIREQASFGAQTLVSGIVTWALFSLDRAFVGKLQTAHAAGLYSAAFNLAVTPLWQMISSLGSHMYASASKEASQPAALGRMLEQSVVVVALLALPAMSVVAATSAELTAIVYGAKWLGAGDAMMPLALAMPFYATYHLASPLFWARGEVWRDILIQSLTFGVLALSLALTVPLWTPAAAWCVLGVYVLRALIALEVSRSSLGAANLDRGALARAFVTGAGSSMAIFLIACASRHILSNKLVTVAAACFTALVMLALQFVLLHRFSRNSGLQAALESIRVRVSTKLPFLRWPGSAN